MLIKGKTTEGFAYEIESGDLSEEIRGRLLTHGLKQKLGDVGAGKKKAGLSDKQVAEKQKELFESIKAGKWGRTKDPVLTAAIKIAVARAGDEPKVRTTLRSEALLKRYCQQKKLPFAKVMGAAETIVEQEREAARKVAGVLENLDF